MCFEDKTFCNFSDCADFVSCPRGFTEKLKREAEQWMEDPPVCFYADRPDCYVLECKKDGKIKPIHKMDGTICPKCRVVLPT